MNTPLHNYQFRKNKTQTAKIIKFQNAEKTTYTICFYRGGQVFQVLEMTSLVDCIAHLRVMEYKETTEKDFQKTPENFEGFCLGFVVVVAIFMAVFAFLYKFNQFL